MFQRFQQLISAGFLPKNPSSQQAQRKGLRQDEPSRFTSKDAFFFFLSKFLVLFIASGFLLEIAFKVGPSEQFHDGNGQKVAESFSTFFCTEQDMTSDQ